jgi:hypothetical protein
MIQEFAMQNQLSNFATTTPIDMNNWCSFVPFVAENNGGYATIVKTFATNNTN